MLTLEQMIFYGVSSLAVVCASTVVLSKNPVRAVLFLALTFFSMAILWMLLRSEFLSIVLILVYVGAIMVLFLFVIMMIDIDLATHREGLTRYFPLGMLVAMVVMGGLVTALGPDYFGLTMIEPPNPEAVNVNNVKLLGELLYTHYLFPLEVAGLLLLAAMVCAISLTFRRRSGNKAIEPAAQVLVQKRDRLRIVQMQSERES